MRDNWENGSQHGVVQDMMESLCSLGSLLANGGVQTLREKNFCIAMLSKAITSFKAS
jgi:hypothetical protein